MNKLLASDGSVYCNIVGSTEGTSYNIIYQSIDDSDYQIDIDALLADFEKSLSVYDPDSIISRVNRNEEIVLDSFFKSVFNRAKEISELTEGAFDISAEPLFRAWGFSAQEKNVPSKDQIEKLKRYIGMDKVSIEDDRILKQHPDIMLNANAIAKGYSADIVANYLDHAGIASYLVEVGGEIRLKGANPEGNYWRVGVDRPSEDNLIPGQDLQLVLQLSDRAIATSGNYRQFYVEDGKKVTHTINPATGYSVVHNLLSTTVLADDAMTADAFATAFLVAGIDKSMEWIDSNPELDALFICDENGEYKVYYTSGMEQYIMSDI